MVEEVGNWTDDGRGLSDEDMLGDGHSDSEGGEEVLSITSSSLNDVNSVQSYEGW